MLSMRLLRLKRPFESEEETAPAAARSSAPKRNGSTTIGCITESGFQSVHASSTSS